MNPIPDDAPGWVIADRRHALRWTLPLLTVLAWCNVPIVAQQPGVGTSELLPFAASGLAFAGLAVLMWRRRLKVPQVALLTLSLLALVLAERIVRLFTSGYFDDGARSFFMPVFAYLLILYLFCFVLLTPVRLAVRVSLLMWAAVLTGIVVLSWPYWRQPARHDSLQALLLFVGPAHGVLILLLGVIARRQERVLRRYARIAASERRAHAGVLRSETHFRSLFDVAGVGMCVTDAQGRFVRVNRCFADLLGHPVESLLALGEPEVTDPEDLADSGARSEALASRRVEGYSLEKRYLHRDGHRVYVQQFVRELAQPPGEPRRYLGVVLDLSQRHAAEQRIREERRLRDLYFERTPLGMIEFDPALRVRRWSAQAEHIFGWTEAEALGRTAEELDNVLPEQIPARDRALQALVSGEREHQQALVPMAHRNGRRLWIEVHRTAVRDAHGRLESLVSMCLDVTERQDMLTMLNQSEARFRGIFNQAAVGIALLDADGRWLNVNDKLCEMLGYPLDELLTLDFQRVTHADDLKRDLDLARAVIERRIDHYRLEKRYVRRDGSTFWALLYVRRLDTGPELPARFVSVVDDISDRKSAEARLAALNTDLEAQVAQRTSQLRELLAAGQRRNEALSQVTEMGRMLSAAADPEEAGRVVMLYLPRIFPQARGALYLAGPGSGPDTGRFDCRLAWGEGPAGPETLAVEDCWGLRRAESHHVEGESDALHCTHTPEPARLHPHLCVPLQALGRALGLIELAWGFSPDGWAPETPLVRNVAEKIGLAFGNLHLREELRQQATVDALTGLHNRRWLDGYLRTRFARQGRDGQGFAVVAVDADHFKIINDRHGHDAGDAALREIAGVLRSSLRAEEALARVGGEEFLAVLETESSDAALQAGERMRQAVQALRIKVNGRDLPPVSVSIGIARLPADAPTLEQVLKRADQALYAAKQNGRNRVCMAEGTPETGLSSH